jgi:hypothetical protein
MAIGLGAEYFCRVTCYYYVIGNIADHHGAGSDRDVITDSYALSNHGANAYMGFVSDAHATGKQGAGRNVDMISQLAVVFYDRGGIDQHVVTGSCL